MSDVVRVDCELPSERFIARMDLSDLLQALYFIRADRVMDAAAFSIEIECKPTGNGYKRYEMTSLTAIIEALEALAKNQ